MSNMTNKEKVSRKIRELVPSLQELSFGCEVEIYGIMDKTAERIIYIGDKDNNWIAQYKDTPAVHIFPKYDMPRYEIIGHPITLNEVLRAIQAVMKDDWCIEMSTAIEHDTEKLHWRIQIHHDSGGNGGTYPLMTSNMKKGIMARMAVLWEQRELVRELDKLEKQALLDMVSKSTLEEHPKALDEVGFSHQDSPLIPENILVDKIRKRRGKKNGDINEIKKIKRCISVCIQEGFIKSESNHQYSQLTTPVPLEGREFLKNSLRKIQVSDDKGSELLNPIYFWFKYIANTFPPLTQIFVTIIITLLTSGFVWWTLLGKIEENIKNITTSNVENYEPKP